MTATPGERSSGRDVYEAARDFYIWPRVSRVDVDSGFPLIFKEGAGVYLRDVAGREYIDLMSSASRASTLGYGDERMAAAISLQLRTLHYSGSGSMAAEPTVRLAARLAELPPHELTATVFTGSGSEANEAALKLARLYQRERGKPRAYKVVSRWNDFHGSAGGAQEASDWLGVRVPAEPGPPGFSRIPAPTCNQCPFGLEHPSCNLRCADFLADHIEHEGPELVSAFLIEPIAQANGVQIPPPGYLARVQEICRRYEVLFIADEIITGFGRTGEWFGIQHWDIEPDIMTVAKAITAGYLPLAATITRAEVRDALAAFPDIHTFGGHPTAAVAALTAISIYESDGLVERAKQLGRELLDTLRRLQDLPAVGEVRGLGLWAAVDFGPGPEIDKQLAPDVLREIVMRARSLGVLVSQNGTAIELAPPMIITSADLREGLSRFERAVREVCA
jgi:adenosylmethionine-8-amino-7-oxononanoate aminotransferase